MEIHQNVTEVIRFLLRTSVQTQVLLAPRFSCPSSACTPPRAPSHPPEPRSSSHFSLQGGHAQSTKHITIVHTLILLYSVNVL